ncbi:MAG: sulfur oxidation c-type cytochrome SoxA [Pseudomonadota bacterium]
MRARVAAAAALLGACGADAPAPERTDLNPADAVSGYTFLTPETQALQDDDFANPGFLWVDQGRALFASTDGVSASCASCHEAPGLAAAAPTHPKIDAASGDLVNLEGRINLCRARYQDAEPLPYESEALLSLTAYVASLSRGAPMSVVVDGAAQASYAMGRDYFFTRRGQLNLACSQCHDDNWGRKLRGDTISQGHGNGFPAYRLEWQGLGSLHRRFQDCDAGVRAAPLDAGSDTYVALELYLAARSEGLAMETPAVRR